MTKMGILFLRKVFCPTDEGYGKGKAKIQKQITSFQAKDLNIEMTRWNLQGMKKAEYVAPFTDT
jgi:hypothetical protein